MTVKTAEIIAIGDELISGQRLDTNSQWISSRLSEIGLEPSFHTCVGDSFDDGVRVFHQATHRADVIICTGGIGPTKDDLTRQVIAEVAEVELELRPEVEDHIRSIFANYGREMPDNNRIQAFFPRDSRIIPNSEGTAPGIDVVANGCRIFALPGVPYEMKEMWEHYVQAQLLNTATNQKTIKHHVVHCFGGGESQIELMLDGMTDRDHIPRVGITASQATISLRITALADNQTQCEQQIETTVSTIHEKLGDLVFGSNGQELQDVVLRMLSDAEQSLAILDFGFGGAAALAIFKSDLRDTILKTAQVKTRRDWRVVDCHRSAAEGFRSATATDVAIVISPTRKYDDQRFYDIAICDSQHTKIVTQKYSGHSGLIDARTVKQILNQLRLHLLSEE